MRNLRSKSELTRDVGSLQKGDSVIIKSKAGGVLGVSKITECEVGDDD